MNYFFIIMMIIMITTAKIGRVTGSFKFSIRDLFVVTPKFDIPTLSFNSMTVSSRL